jgi:hypothetical protein
MMEAARTSETSICIQLRTRQYIPEDSQLQEKNPSLEVKASGKCIETDLKRISLCSPFGEAKLLKRFRYFNGVS